MNTPDTDWESGYDAMVEDARLYSDFPDPLAKHIKGYVRKELSSRDTYWKDRVRGFRSILLDLDVIGNPPISRVEYTEMIDEALDTLLDNLK